VWQNPYLGSVLSDNPNWIKSPTGRQQARVNASLVAPQGSPNGIQQVPATQGGAVRPRPRAYVETGPSGAPVSSAPGERPKGDAFDEVMELNERIKGKKASVFFRSNG
jgi:hypothetical protein